MDLVVNTQYRVIICLSCGTALELTTLESHVHAHFPRVLVPPDLAIELKEEYDFVSLKDIAIPRSPPAPIFGLTLTTEIFHFCSRCGRGYRSADTLRSHQTMADRCPRVEGEPVTQVTQIRGHGQQFSFGTYNRIFRVDPSKLPLREEASDTHCVPTLSRLTFV
jgi:DNA-directed RNA polymerase subunit RPC12/RpoP